MRKCIPGPLLLNCTASERKLGEGLGTRLTTGKCCYKNSYTHVLLSPFYVFTCYSNRISSIFFPRVLLISVPPGCGYNSRAGTKQGRGQYRLGARAILRASTRALCYDTRSSLLSQPRYLLGRQLPSLQALQCTRWSSVPRCKLCNQTFVPGAPPTMCGFHYCLA